MSPPMKFQNKIMTTRLELFPVTAGIQNNRLTLDGQSLSALAEEYGTPLYLYDQASMDSAACAYLSALKETYPDVASVTYAGKAFLCKAIAQWTQTHNLWVDCAGESEIAIAQAGGVPREHILVHGVNKSHADLRAALASAKTIVVDNLLELRRIAELIGQYAPQHISLWLRLLPGESVHTHHAHTQTGHAESKFGMTQAELLQAAAFCKERKLPLTGIHFHQGSNFRDPSPLHAAIELGLNLAQEIGFTKNWHFSPGGGWGVAYHEDELPQPDPQAYVRFIAERVLQGCQQRGLSLPHLHLEPGRSLIARAGVALYKVGAIKQRGEKTWILTDGGMTDNPRFALYGARYSCMAENNPQAESVGRISIAGPYCESGDVILENLDMPALQPGDLLAIPAAGAYQLSMSSNYNGARKPAVLLLNGGGAKLIQRRETTQDLLNRDLDL